MKNISYSSHIFWYTLITLLKLPTIPWQPHSRPHIAGSWMKCQRFNMHCLRSFAWRSRRSLVALPPKLSSTKNNLASYGGSEIFSLQNLSFFLYPHACERFLLSGEIPWIIFLMRFHTHHSLDFIRKLKMCKITGYIHLYYKIPSSSVACILVTFSFFFFDNSHRVLFQYFQCLIYGSYRCVMGSAMDKR